VNFTQNRSPAALIIENLCCQSVHVSVAPRDDSVAHIEIVTWWSASGIEVQKSQLFLAEACWCAGRVSRHG
jgi:hypothetical protein